MSRVSLVFGVLCALVAVTGCGINDSTENEFAPRIINDTRFTATIVYCSGISSCGRASWTEMLHPGRRAADNINAGRENLSVFLVKEDGNRGCIRLAHFRGAIRVSEATSNACHPPYG